MGRIYKNEFDQYVIWSNNTNAEKLAFEHNGFEGSELREALYNYKVPVLLTGWDCLEVIKDLEESGLIPLPEKVVEQPNIFRVIQECKNGVYWEHTPTKRAKYFHFRVLEHKSQEWSTDRWKGMVGGGYTGTMSYRSWTLQDVEADFNAKPKSWREYEILYNPNFRQDDIKFID